VEVILILKYVERITSAHQQRVGSCLPEDVQFLSFRIQLQDTQARQEVQGIPLEDANKQGEKEGRKMVKREKFPDAQ
jgi:hypothetical protein